MKKVFILSFAAMAALFSACGIFKHSTQYVKNSATKLLDTATITKGGVSIKLTALDMNEYFKPEYAAEIKVLWGANGTISTRSTIINLFLKMTVYKVEIVNNTNNVLSFEDARVALILPEMGEPIFATTKDKMLTEAISGSLPCIPFEVQQIQRSYSNVSRTTYDYVNAVAAEMVKSKIIVSRSSEIMPSMKLTGYVVFPYNSEKINEGTISFIDVKTETNEAGNVTQKTRFDFRVKQMTIYAKREYDEAQKKYQQYVPITEADYNASQQSKK